MAKRIEAATGIETRATILGHMQRGGTPTCKDRVYASIMGARAAELLAEGKSNRLVAYKHGEFVDYDIQEALNMKKDIPEEHWASTPSDFLEPLTWILHARIIPSALIQL